MSDVLQRVLSGDKAATAVFHERLASLGFRDVARAVSRLLGLADSREAVELAANCLHKLVGLLSEVADPDAGLIDFERFIQRVDDRGELFQFLNDNPRAIEVLVRLFASSRYLTETVLRNPETLWELTHHRRLADLKSREEFLDGALSAVGAARDFASRRDALRRFQRWELLRIGASDAFGLIDLRAATVQLSLLADSLVQACLTLSAHELMMQSTALTVLALGKLGGEELNYSSDIDLVFLTDRSPTEALPLAQRLVKALQDSTAEGFLYRVDVRLRPWGRSGELITTIPSYLDYLKSHAELWEKQALLKARVIAGSRDLGAELLRRVESFVYGASAQDVRAAVRQAKSRIEAELRRRGREWGELKLGTGSIRDVEFVVQALQLVHGASHPHVRTPNTLDGLVRLTDAGVLHADEYRRLTDGYVFLRTIEHSLQLMHNRQEHSLPAEPRELTALARRLDFASADQLLAHYNSHRASIRAIFDKYLSDDRALTAPVTAPSIPDRKRHCAQPSLATYDSVFSEIERRRHAELLAKLDADHPVRVVAEPEESSLWRITVLAHDCPGELSMICGLLFAYGFDITEGFVSTDTRPSADSGRRRDPRACVDVFTVRSEVEVMLPEVWQRYEDDLTELVQLAQAGRADEAQGRLAKRVAEALEDSPDTATRPAPLEVRFDNEAHDRATVLHIRGDDTMGFLYELSNALTLSGVNIEQVVIRAEQHRAFDTLLVTDTHSGGKILEPARLQELQAAVVLIKHFTHLLPAAPNPNAALLHFRSFLRDLFRRSDWLEQLSSLERPEVLAALAQLLGVSDFLWEDFLRLQYANLFPVLRDIAGLERAKSKSQLAAELESALGIRPRTDGISALDRTQMTDATNRTDRIDKSHRSHKSHRKAGPPALPPQPATTSPDEQRRQLNEFKDRELFRIDMRHILGHSGGIEPFGSEMTDLAEVVVAAAVELCWSELVDRFGAPRMANGRECPLSVCALGKCGGRELGFASDIELMFVYEADGMTDGEALRSGGRESPGESIAGASFFSRLVESVCHAIHARSEGIFRVDLRLRPYGRAGSLAVSLDSFRSYFQPDGPAWPYERQALVKLRPIAGDGVLSRKLIALRDEMVYTGQPVDFAAIRAMRERQVRQHVGASEFNAKLSPGGLVDLEYLVQALQICRGAQHVELRTTNTREALDALRQFDVLDADDHRRLAEAYNFLRRLIDALRMVRGDARDLTVPPAQSAEFDSLARRLGYGAHLRRLQDDLARHTLEVAELVRSHSERPCLQN